MGYEEERLALQKKYFGVVPQDKLDELAKKYNRDLYMSNANPQPGDMCESQYQGKWYKAKVVELLNGGTKIKVSFLEFKYQPIVGISDVRFRVRLCE